MILVFALILLYMKNKCKNYNNFIELRICTIHHIVGAARGCYDIINDTDIETGNAKTESTLVNLDPRG